MSESFGLYEHFKSDSPCISCSAGENKRIQVKRGSLDFYAMVRCEIGRDPLEYIGYGCWCGLGGKGKPVDEIDR